jgi:oxygen-independent coproporphyrinogen III oxidase
MQAPVLFHSLYIHVPFCQNICDYCDLYSIVNNKSSTRQLYLEKIRAELKSQTEQLQNLQSIFIGGGTPSQLTIKEMKFFFNSIKEFTSLVPNYEFTVECNPSSTTLEKLLLLQDYQVNRLSFGAQSTTRKTRHALGRRTSKAQLEQALENADKSHFDNINIDLIYAIPGQELGDWQHDLETALSYKLSHYSAYSLILEENTPITQKFQTVDDDLAVDMYDLTEQMLNQQQLSRYEISNYSLKDKHCQHNYDIWKGASYLGIGPAASSFDGQNRWTQVRDLEKWLNGETPDIDKITHKERVAEVIGFGFRTVNGWQKKELQSLLNTDALALFHNTFEELKAQDLLKFSADSIKPTELGLLFADTVAESFISI